jgi:X-X-X-Leu-X-X-Gly heptad repeat protein
LVQLAQLVGSAGLVKLRNQLTQLFDGLTKAGQLVRLTK